MHKINNKINFENNGNFHIISSTFLANVTQSYFQKEILLLSR